MKSIAKNMSRFIKDGRKMKEQKSMLMTFGLVKKFPMVFEAWKQAIAGGESIVLSRTIWKSNVTFPVIL